MKARAASPRARYGREVGTEATSTVRVLPDEEDPAGCVDKINCTYPIDFNPCTLCTKIRILALLPVKKKAY